MNFTYFKIHEFWVVKLLARCVEVASGGGGKSNFSQSTVPLQNRPDMIDVYAIWQLNPLPLAV